MRRVLVVLAGILAVVVIVAVIGVLVLSQTDWGRERVRRMALSALEGSAHGIVRIGAVRGNLLGGVTIEDLSIRDSAGAPFVLVRSASASYSLAAFLRREIRLSNVRLIEPTIVLAKVDGDWNFERIFPGDTMPTDTAPGWGDLVVFRGVEIERGRLIVRTPWRPGDELTGARRDSAIAEAVGGGGRLHVVQTADGRLEQVMDFQRIDADLPLVRLAHPDHEAGRLEFETLRMVALPFNPPAAEVRDLVGVFEFNGDSLWWQDARARLPGSAIAGAGKYALDPEEVILRLRGDPVALADLRWLYPRLPATGGGTLDFVMTRTEDTARYVASNAALQVEDARLGGSFGMTDAEEGFSFHDTDLRFSRFSTGLIEQLVPGLEVPAQGELGGSLVLAGDPRALQLDADVTFDSPRAGRSAMLAEGRIGFLEDGIAASNLRVQLAPFRVELARAFAPELPLDGTVTGTALLNGSTATRLAARATLVHEGSTGRSRIVGDGAVQLTGRRWMDIDLRAQPVALTTVSGFLPVDLQGAVAGPVRVRGPFDALDVDGDLAITGGGFVAIRGRVAVAREPVAYRLNVGLHLFNASLVLPGAPPTSITATASAIGTGLDPATMNARFQSDIAASVWNEVGIDSAVLRLTVANGLLRVDSARMSGPSGQVRADGAFGLVAGRTAALTYNVAIDSLRAFARWIPLDTGVVEPRPAVAARALARAREDSARLAEATEVERAITGAPPPRLAVDTPAVVRRDSVAGAVYAAGTLRGNVEQFDARGRAAVSQLVLGGNAVQSGRAEYAWLARGGPVASTTGTAAAGGAAEEMGRAANPGTVPGRLLVAAELDSVSLAGFFFDSVATRVAHEAPGGTLTLVVHAPGQHVYTADLRYALHLDHNEVHLNTAILQLDTARWASTRPGAIRWGARGVEIDRIELRSGELGRIYLNGLLPTEGLANLEIAVDNFQIEHLTTLLQADPRVRGLVSLTADIDGTSREPRMRGAMGVVGGEVQGTRIPELHATAEYEGGRLQTRVIASRFGGQPLATADAVLPLNLAFTADAGPRLPSGPLRIDVRIDSLPLDLVPALNDVVTPLRGLAVGSVAVRGTTDDPAIVGALAISDGAFRIEATGVTVHDVAGALAMEGETIRVDSIVGRSAGPMRLAGLIEVRDWRDPAFNLRFASSDAWLLDNRRGRIRADARVQLTGSMRRPYLRGDVNILRGVIYAPEEDDRQVLSARDPALFSIVDTAAVAERDLLEEESTPLANLRADLNLRVSRGTWVRSPEANVEIFGDLIVQIDQRRDEMILTGNLNTERGEYTFLSRRFEITHGSVIFIGTGELNPTLQITAEYLVPLSGREPLRIQLLIGGTLQRPRLTVESNAQPPLTQSDLLALLAFGRPTASLLQFEGPALGAGGGGGLTRVGGLAFQQLSSVAAGVLVNTLEGQAARELGADVLNITPGELPGLGISRLNAFLIGTEIEVGKYVDPNTFVAITARPQPVLPGVLVQRRLPRDLRVEGTYATRYFFGEPTLGEPEFDTGRVFGLFLTREWKFSLPLRNGARLIRPGRAPRAP